MRRLFLPVLLFVLFTVFSAGQASRLIPPT